MSSSTLMRNILITGVLAIGLSGCTTISNWFADEEEIAIRTLEPIDAKFTPQVVWERDLGIGVGEYYSVLRPVFAYDKLYAAERHGEVVALEPSSGAVLWEKNFAIYRDTGFWSFLTNLWSSGESAKLAAMSVGYNQVFVGTEDGILMALNADSGELIWEQQLAGEILAPPAMDEGILVVNTGAGALFAFDARTGEQLWRNESDVPPLTLRGISAPAAANGGALLGTPGGKLQVNLLNNGLLAWETPITTPSGATELERIVDVDSAPLLFGGIVYTISYNGTLAAIELRSGRIVWKREYGAYRNLSISGNTLFVVDNKSSVFGVDRRNGVEMWSQGRLKGRVLTAAEPFGDYAVVGDNYGYLHWLDQADGSIVARYALGSDDKDEAIYASPLKMDDKLVAVTRDGVIAALTIPQ